MVFLMLTTTNLQVFLSYLIRFLNKSKYKSNASYNDAKLDIQVSHVEEIRGVSIVAQGPKTCTCYHCGNGAHSSTSKV